MYMANKRSISKSKKSVKNNREEKLNHNKVIESVGEFDADYKKVLLVAGIIIIVFAAFYFLTVFITGRSTTKTNTTTGETYISYSEIMAGRSFSMPENEYLVLYYDKSDSELLSTYSSIVSSYRSKEDHLTIYTVDMSDALNKTYISEEKNISPSNVSELKINGPTLIRFREGQVANFVEEIGRAHV